MSSSGGAITTVASSAYVTQFLLATSTDVYWNAGANFTEIEAVAVGGGTPKALTSLSGGTNTGWFAIDKTSLYFVDNSSDLYAEPLAGGKATSLGASLSIDNLQMLVSDGTYLYALDNNGEQDDLVKVDIATHKMTTLAANVVVNTQNPAGTQLAVDKTNVYWNDYNGDLMKLALAGGGKPVKLASSAVAFTVDGDYAYFVGQTVSKVPVAGGKATTLYSSTYYNTDGFSPCVTTVATDATYVYWDCGGGEGKGYPGNILRIAK
jgi:hypothetical protein